MTAPARMPGHDPVFTVDTSAQVDQWLADLEARHLANLRFPEVTRALRALSSAYVERRAKDGPRGALDGAGKRAAFALFYAPLHFIATATVVRALGAHEPPPPRILDVGCGTGVAGAAWALTATSPCQITGVDRNGWAVDEARWTYSRLGLAGRAVVGDAAKVLRPKPGDGVVAAYVLNELSDAARPAVELLLSSFASEGARVLILEPVSRRAVPWWDATAGRLAQHGFRADEWRFAIDRPPLIRKFDEASGLDHRVLTLRTLYRA